MIRRIAIACLVVLAQGAQASAQAPATPRGSGSAATNCTPTVARPDADGVNTVGRANEPLTDKLAQSDGVLCPPANTNPEIRVPAPDGGTAKTPVIPPPGSVGGDPSVRPK
jgi:hypothetical protein